MKVIGIVGGVASGKSTVAREIARLGAAVVNADEAAHRVLETPEVKAALVDRWGEDVLLPDGRIDRASISRKVFGDAASAEERAFLEGLVHPGVRHDLERQLGKLEQGGTAVVVLDVPLLVEVGWNSMCDVVYFVDASEEARRRRATDRGWSTDELRIREAAQAPLARKQMAADRVIENSGDRAALRQQVEAAYRELTG